MRLLLSIQTTLTLCQVIRDQTENAALRARKACFPMHIDITAHHCTRASPRTMQAHPRGRSALSSHVWLHALHVQVLHAVTEASPMVQQLCVELGRSAPPIRLVCDAHDRAVV